MSVREAAAFCFFQGHQVLSLIVVIHWMVISVSTLKGVVSGKIFVGPGVAKVQRQGKEENHSESISQS